MYKFISMFLIVSVMSLAGSLSELVEQGQYPKILKLYELSPNDSALKYEVGIMYSNGQGVKKDHKKAYELIKNSSDKGNAKAQYELGTMYILATYLKRDYKKAVPLLKSSAKKGNQDALYLLGYLHNAGIGVDKDKVKAYIYFKKAQYRGSPEAEKYLERFCRNNRSICED